MQGTNRIQLPEWNETYGAQTDEGAHGDEHADVRPGSKRRQKCADGAHSVAHSKHQFSTVASRHVPCRHLRDEVAVEEGAEDVALDVLVEDEGSVLDRVAASLELAHGLARVDVNILLHRRVVQSRLQGNNNSYSLILMNLA